MAGAGVLMGSTTRQIGRLFSAGTVSGLSDAALLRRFAQDSDEEAFAALMARHGPMVLSVVRNVLRDPSGAEDAFQATFLVLIRRAPALWVEESLGGWLHRVAFRVALRANAESARRRARERVAVAALSDEGRRERPEAGLHEEIARLSEDQRRAVVLCYFEGKTHAEAAREMRCGEATVRRRLAGARERLKSRMHRRGLAAPAVIAPPALPVPPPWIAETIRNAVATANGRGPTTAGAARLASEVAAGLRAARGLRIAGTAIAILGVGLAALGGYRRIGSLPPQPAPVLVAPVVPKPAQEPGPKWAHVKYDTGAELWVRLADARELWRSGDDVGLSDPETNTTLTHRGQGPIELRRGAIWAEGQGRPDTSALLVIAKVEFPDAGKTKPGRAPEEQRRDYPVFYDYEIEDFRGRECLRIDHYSRDTLGQARMVDQTWVDRATHRPLRRRELLQAGEQRRYGREYRTGDYDYFDAGPVDLFALGVPRETPIVEPDKQRPQQPADVKRVIEGAARAFRRLPLNYRIVTRSPDQVEVLYGTMPDEFQRAWSDLWLDPTDNRVHQVPPPQSLWCDAQGSTSLPADLRKLADSDPRSIVSLDQLAEFLAREKPCNAHLHEGKREFSLNRFVVDGGKSWRIRVHVSKDSPEIPRPFEDLWPYALQRPTLIEAEPGTPPGQVVLKADQEHFRYVWYVDPNHDFLAVRKATWRRPTGGDWRLFEDLRAKEFAALPEGVSYVSLWERRYQVTIYGVDQDGRPILAGTQEDRTDYRRVEIKALTPDDFPAGVFDGDQFLNDARAKGAEVAVD